MGKAHPGSTAKTTVDRAKILHPRSVVTITSAFDGPTQTERFGDVTVTARRPTDDDVQHSIDASTAAPGRTLTASLKPGARIRAKKDVPMQPAAPEESDVFIRVLNGKRDRGILENGQIKVSD